MRSFSKNSLTSHFYVILCFSGKSLIPFLPHAPVNSAVVILSSFMILAVYSAVNSIKSLPHTNACMSAVNFAVSHRVLAACLNCLPFPGPLSCRIGPSLLSLLCLLRCLCAVACDVCVSCLHRLSPAVCCVSASQVCLSSPQLLSALQVRYRCTFFSVLLHLRIVNQLSSICYKFKIIDK